MTVTIREITDKVVLRVKVKPYEWVTVTVPLTLLIALCKIIPMNRTLDKTAKTPQIASLKTPTAFLSTSRQQATGNRQLYTSFN